MTAQHGDTCPRCGSIDTSRTPRGRLVCRLCLRGARQTAKRRQTELIDIRDCPSGWRQSSRYVFIGQKPGYYRAWVLPDGMPPKEYRDWLLSDSGRILSAWLNCQWDTLVCDCGGEEHCHGHVLVWLAGLGVEEIERLRAAA
jgi:hypothetical protein